MTTATTITPNDASDEVSVTPVDSGAHLTKWINKMTSPAPIRGHALAFSHGAWCACGRYCGGVGALPGDGWRQHARTAHYLHLLQVRNVAR